MNDIRVLTIAIVALLVAGVVSVFVMGGGGGPLDERDAAACGTSIVDDIGLRPIGVSARLDGVAWRVSVATDAGVIGLIIRAADGDVQEVAMVGPGGSQRIDRDTRLAIFEHGC